MEPPNVPYRLAAILAEMSPHIVSAVALALCLGACTNDAGVKPGATMAPAAAKPGKAQTPGAPVSLLPALAGITSPAPATTHETVTCIANCSTP